MAFFDINKIIIKPAGRGLKTISVFNDIIMATHNDQSNLIHVYILDEVKSLRLTRNTPSDKLTFD